MEDEILAVMGNRPGMMTYHIANCLRADHHKYNGKLTTSTVLRCLKRMEKAGRVERVRSPYAVQICWAKAAPDAADQPSSCGDSTQ